LPKMKNSRDKIPMASPNSASGGRKNLRILVADDSVVNQKIAQLILEKAGYHVDVVENGHQAVEICQRNHYDLILMDIQMPYMDGHEATRQIRAWELEAQSSKLKKKDSAELSAFSFQPSARAQRVPIIAMTGNASEGGFSAARCPGMNDGIGKPLQRDHLLAVVEKWTATESMRDPQAAAVSAGCPPAGRVAKDQAPLDFDRAVEEFMGQKDILLGILDQFMNKAGEQMQTIRQAAACCDYGRIASEAHALKGGAANLRADELAGVASGLEQAAAAKQPEPVFGLAEKLENEFDRLANYIRRINLK
jgi:CheY-like chemotaxis protein/HPt (histidine-containing phosphotransfer) domain-containing protein